jgi:hypothetical protein
MELPVDIHRQQIDPEGHYLHLAVRIDFDDVTLAPTIAPQSFVLEPPRGGHRVRRFVLSAEELNGSVE